MAKISIISLFFIIVTFNSLFASEIEIITPNHDKEIIKSNTAYFSIDAEIHSFKAIKKIKILTNNKLEEELTYTQKNIYNFNYIRDYEKAFKNPLNIGNNKIEIVVEDFDGNTKKKLIVVIYKKTEKTKLDSSINLKILNPKETEITTELEEFELKFIASSKIPIISYSILNNNENISSENFDNNENIKELNFDSNDLDSKIMLKNGVNKIKIKVSNSLSKEIEKEIIINYKKDNEEKIEPEKIKPAIDKNYSKVEEKEPEKEKKNKSFDFIFDFGFQYYTLNFFSDGSDDLSKWCHGGYLETFIRVKEMPYLGIGLRIGYQSIESADIKYNYRISSFPITINIKGIKKYDFGLNLWSVAGFGLGYYDIEFDNNVYESKSDFNFYANIDFGIGYEITNGLESNLTLSYNYFNFNTDSISSNNLHAFGIGIGLVYYMDLFSI